MIGSSQSRFHSSDKETPSLSALSKINMYNRVDGERTVRNIGTLGNIMVGPFQLPRHNPKVTVFVKLGHLATMELCLATMELCTVLHNMLTTY